MYDQGAPPAPDTDTNRTIKFIVGPGNPGAEYAATRHNAGFWLVDQLARMGNVTLHNETHFHGYAACVSLQDSGV